MWSVIGVISIFRPGDGSNFSDGNFSDGDSMIGSISTPLFFDRVYLQVVKSR